MIYWNYTRLTILILNILVCFKELGGTAGENNKGDIHAILDDILELHKTYYFDP